MRSAVFGLAVLAAAGRASAETPGYALADPSVSMRFDTLFQGTPHFVLTAQEGAPSPDDRYWHDVFTAPLMERVNLDARSLAGGLVDAHLSAWGAINLAAGSADGLAAGDLAVAYARAAKGAWEGWLGRRFVAWGLPGGLHVDGGGAGFRTSFGMYIEAMAGRPVTPSFASALGPQIGFQGATGAGGVRVGYANPGFVAASVGYVEEWNEGIPANRVVSGNMVWTPIPWLDLRGNTMWDLLAQEVVQASVDASVLIARRAEVGLAYNHIDPALLIPKWSILSVFATGVYDEAAINGNLRLGRAVTVSAEFAVRRTWLPGGDDQALGPNWGYRADAAIRWMVTGSRSQLVLHVSRRDDGVTPLTVVRAAAAFPLGRSIGMALEAATAIDNDDVNSPRTSIYARCSTEVPVGEGWRVGASVDGARTPIALAELRAVLHATWTLDIRERHP